MTEKLKQLYQQVILHHSKHPVHFAKKEDATYNLEAYNPLCGDKFQLFIEVNDGSIAELHFHGMGCAISKASTSVMVDMLEKVTLAEAKEKCSDFLQMLAGKEPEVALSDEMLAFDAARMYPGRKKCATLAWEEMQHFLAQYTS